LHLNALIIHVLTPAADNFQTDLTPFDLNWY